MSRITGKKYLRIEFSLASPLIIGCGKNENTDNDVLTNNLGIPYIPGTAIAGVIRSSVEDAGVGDDSDMDKVFGFIDGEKSRESSILFYDANIVGSDRERFNISIRDSVALDEYKTAKDGAKFDMEVLEPGVSFVTYAELNEDDDIKDRQGMFWEAIKSIWKAEIITFGGKSTRGMGAVKVNSIKEATFDFSEKEDIKKWLKFNMYEDNVWEDITVETRESSGIYVLDLKLKLLGGISIRRYSTNVEEADYEQLTVMSPDKEDEDIPVVPGTSWAGAFRHRIEELSGETGKALADEWFGKVETGGNGSKTRSRITFSESQISGGAFKEITRNAIDRFTGGAADGALYTEKTYYGGDTELKIVIKSDSIDENFGNALAAAIADLHGGYLAVGGLTAVGRGLFKVTAVNGEDNIEEISAEELYKKICGILSEAGREAD